jgi:hypothetical protein
VDKQLNGDKMVNEEKLKELRQISQDYSKRIEEMKTELEVSQKANAEKLSEISDKMRIKIDQDNFMPFLNKPYVLIPTGKHEEWYVPVPKFIRMNLGWLDFSTDTYNIFKINKYMNWLGELPAELEGKFKGKMKLPLQVFDGMLLTGKEHQEDAWNKFDKFLSRREGTDKIKIKKGYEFQLLAELIDNGILPFMKQPVQTEDLLERPVKFTLRDYQKEAWDKFLETGATGVFWAFSAGKTFFGLKALSSIKGNKLIVVPTVTLVEQWTERIKEYTDLREGETSIVTYHSFDKVRDKEWALVIFDEVHHLPANQFSRFATLNTRYRIGLCLHPRTTITLENGGVKSIKEIVDNKLPVKVLSYNHRKEQIEPKPIIKYHKIEAEEILRIKIKTERGIKKILCSPQHEFFTKNEYKMAINLKCGDEVLLIKQPHCSLNNPAKGVGEKISNSLKGRKMTKDHCNNISKSLKGKFTGVKNPFYGKTHTEKVRNHLSEIHKGKRYSPETEFKKGHEMTDEINMKRSITMKMKGSVKGKNNGMYGKSGALNPNWKGGISYWRKKYYNSIPYKEWRDAVFIRDSYSCRKCGKKGDIQAHHIKPFAKYKNIRFDINNGITLCERHHKIEHRSKI